MQQYNFQPQVVDQTPVFDPSDKILGQHVERDGIVTLRPISPSQHRNETLTIGGFKGYGYWDAGKTQKYWFGTVVGNNPDGSKKFKKINIVDGRMFYLQNPEDAWEWFILKHHFAVKGSPNEMGKARWRVEDERKDSRDAISKATKFTEVFGFISKMSESRVKSFGRIFGLDPINNPWDVIKGQLLTKAMDKPEIFMPYMQDAELTNIREAFHRAVSTNVIVFRLDRGYLFNDSIPLGSNEEMAIGNLMANKDLFVNIDMIARSRDKALGEDEKTPEIKMPAKKGKKEDEEKKESNTPKGEEF